MDHQDTQVQDREPTPELTVAAQKLERELLGPEMVIGERRLQPLAQLTGWHGSDAHAQAGLAGAWVRLRPTGLRVYEADGSETLVPIVDPTMTALRGMLLAGLVVAAICWVVMLIRRCKG